MHDEALGQIPAMRTGLNALLGMRVVLDGPDEVAIDMPVGDACLQPFGFVHGGATLSLLEAAGSRAAELRCNLDEQLPFGVHMDVRHKKSCRAGTVHARATLQCEQDLGERGTRQEWRVVATDDAGDVMSEGTFVTRIVPKSIVQAG